VVKQSGSKNLESTVSAEILSMKTAFWYYL